MANIKLEDNVIRQDARSKARGEAVYVSDMRLKGMQYALFVRSNVPRAKIKEIIVPKIKKPYRFITYLDIPYLGKNELLMMYRDWPAFAEKDVKFVGETIGVLTGPDKRTLRALKKSIKIVYEEEEPVVTIDDAESLKGGAIFGEDNVICSLTCNKGKNIDAVFEEADEIIDETFRTGFQEHVHLETNGMLATLENGNYVLYASCQCPFYIRKAVADLLRVPENKIIVRQTTTGGAFGGKENFPDVLAGPLLVALSVVRKPLMLIYEREEDMLYSVKRHPSKIHYETAIKDGKIIGVKGDIKYNVGAYLSSSFVVLQRGVFHANGVYDFPSTYLTGEGMATNTFPSDAFRGFGAPQTLFAIEMHMNHIADHMGKDRADFKREYFIKQGGITVTEGHIAERVMLNEMFETLSKESDYYRKVSEYKRGFGRGIGVSFYNHGGAFTGNGEFVLIKAKVRLVKKGDEVEIQIGSTEMGQGFPTAARKIASIALGIDLDKVKYANPDTSFVADSGPTVASRSTMIVGALVEKAANKMKERWNEGDFTSEADYEYPEGFTWDQEKLKGDAYTSYSWGVAIVEVEVDKLTKEVKTTGIWTSHEVGKTIDEQIARGQVNGGVIQSLGYASMEKMDNVNGYFKQKSLSDYIIPSSMDYPKQYVHFQDNPFPYGPFGAKGMGELVFNGADSAFADALERALDIKIYSIPLLPEIIEEKIHAKSN